MKKLIPLMIGLCLTFGTVVAFAQADPPKKEDTGKTKAPKKAPGFHRLLAHNGEQP